VKSIGRAVRWSLAFVGAVAQAQATSVTSGAPSARGAILGAVTDTALTPIADADIEIVGTRIEVNSNANGRFLVTSLPAGLYIIVVRRVAFLPSVNVAEVRAGDTLRLAFLLAPSTTELAPVVVTERASTARLREFEARRAQGVGEFFTQAEIERRNPVSITDMLRQSKTLNISPENDHGVFAKSRRNVAYACFVQVYLDGVPLAGTGPIGPDGKLPPPDLHSLPSPKELMGVEIYAGAATAPNWLPIGPSAAHPGCGVIMLWTRDGSGQ